MTSRSDLQAALDRLSPAPWSYDPDHRPGGADQILDANDLTVCFMSTAAADEPTRQDAEGIVPLRNNAEELMAEAQRGAEASEAMQTDIAAALRALGLSDHARDASPHEVMVGEVIPAIVGMREKLSDESLQDRVDYLAETMLAAAVYDEAVCECGHSEGCDNLVVALVLCEQSDGAPESWLMCRGCVDHAKVGGVMPETTKVYWNETADVPEVSP